MKRYVILIVPCSAKVGQLISAALMSAIKSGDRQIQWHNKFPKRITSCPMNPEKLKYL